MLGQHHRINKYDGKTVLVGLSRVNVGPPSVA